MSGRNPNGTFAKGNSGGPGRKRKRYRIEHLLEKVGQEKVMIGEEEVTKLEALLRAVYGYALKGNSWAVQFVADRTEGRVAFRQWDDDVADDKIEVARFDFEPLE